MANADHLIGALVVTVTAIACAEVARPVRFLNAALGTALLITPFAYATGTAQTFASIACGLALIALSVRRGPITSCYGSWKRWLF
jgi:hypothetical protein